MRSFLGGVRSTPGIGICLTLKFGDMRVDHPPYPFLLGNREELPC